MPVLFTFWMPDFKLTEYLIDWSEKAEYFWPWRSNTLREYQGENRQPARKQWSNSSNNVPTVSGSPAAAGHSNSEGNWCGTGQGRQKERRKGERERNSNWVECFNSPFTTASLASEQRVQCQDRLNTHSHTATCAGANMLMSWLRCSSRVSAMVLPIILQLFADNRHCFGSACLENCASACAHVLVCERVSKWLCSQLFFSHKASVFQCSWDPAHRAEPEHHALKRDIICMGPKSCLYTGRRIWQNMHANKCMQGNLCVRTFLL